MTTKLCFRVEPNNGNVFENSSFFQSWSLLLQRKAKLRLHIYCVNLTALYFCRCGLSHKNKLSYEKFLSAFQDNRRSGYGRVTLDTPGKVATPVVFERHEYLTPDAAVNRLRKKISENPETIQRVSHSMKRLLDEDEQNIVIYQ